MCSVVSAACPVTAVLLRLACVHCRAEPVRTYVCGESVCGGEWGCVVCEMCAMCVYCCLCVFRVVLYVLCVFCVCDCDTCLRDSVCEIDCYVCEVRGVMCVWFCLCCVCAPLCAWCVRG